MTEAHPEPDAACLSPRGKGFVVWVALSVVVLGLGAVRWRVLDVPLERDEGEYAVAGHLILEGVAPYDRAYNMKLPGIYGVYAVILAVFGETDRGIHQGLLFANAASLVLLFLLGRALVDEWTGFAAATVFGILSLGRSVQGMFANAEHFVLLFALAGLYLLVRANRTRRVGPLLGGGFLLGLSFVTKQHGALFAAFGGLYVLLGYRPYRWRDMLARGFGYGLSAATPYLLTCLVLWWAGVFDNFWFWTFEYAREYTQQIPWDLVGATFRRSAVPIFRAAPIAWVLAGLGLLSPLWFTPARRSLVFFVPFTLFSFLAVCPGFFFRPHYFVLLLPAAALCAGIGVRSLACLRPLRKLSGSAVVVPCALTAIAVIQALIVEKQYLFELTPHQISRFTYGTNPFPESVQIGEYVRNSTAPSDSIVVVGSEPQIYFYADRPAATSYMYTYALVEDQPYNLEMQQEFIRQVEENEPELLIFVRIQTSWLTNPRAPQCIFHWLAEYTDAFEVEAVLDIRMQGTRLIQGKDLVELDTEPNSAIYIYRRKR